MVQIQRTIILKRKNYLRNIKFIFASNCVPFYDNLCYGKILSGGVCYITHILSSRSIQSHSCPFSSMTILKRIQNVWNTWKISEINTFVLWGYIVESIRTTNTKWSDIPNWSTTFCVFRHLMRHCKVLSYQQFANNAGLVLRYPIKRWKIHQSDRTIVYIYDII